MGLRDFEPTPIDPDSLKDLSDEELIELHEKLEALHLEEQRLDIVAFALNTEVPGTPLARAATNRLGPNETLRGEDRIAMLRRKEALNRARNEAGEYVEIEDVDLSDPDVEQFYPEQLEVYEHQQMILEVMQALMEEEPIQGPLANGFEGRYADGVILMFPPGASKSTYASVIAPAWIAGRYANTDIISLSYGADLARRFGRRVRHIARSAKYERQFGATVVADNQAVDQWSLTNGSTYKATGILGGVTGNRADLAICDDIIAGREEAESEIIREKTWQALKDDVLTRLKPRGKICVIATRWHEDDPIGRLLGEEWDGQSGLIEGTDKRLWLVLCVPLIADNDDDPLGRARGEVLWPEWFDEKHVAFARAQGERSWNSLYQQKPSASDGNILLKSQWRCWPHGKAEPTEEQRQHPERTQPPKLGEFRQTVLVYDTALEDDEDDDYSAMTAWVTFETTKKLPQRKMAEEKMQNILLTGAWRKKVPAAELLTIVLGHIKFFEPDRVVIEKRASGIQLIQELRKRRPRHQYGEVIIEAWLPPGPVGAKGKRPRAHAASLSLTEGSVWYMPGAIQEAVIKECMPAGTKIVTKDGIKNIEDMVVGDMVLTHKGRWRPVTATSKREADHVYRIKAKALDEIRMTGEHPIYGLDIGYQGVVRSEPRWIDAQDAGARPTIATARGIEAANVPHMAICLPTMVPEVEIERLDLGAWAQGNIGARYETQVLDDKISSTHWQVHDINRWLPMTHQSGRLLGLYLAEGSITNGMATWSINKTEGDLTSFIMTSCVELFGVTPNMPNEARQTARRICMAASSIQSFFHDFGRSSDQKRVPAWAWDTPSEFRRGLLDGWIDGDGRVDRGVARGATVSDVLAWQMRILAQSVGLSATAITRPGGPGEINGRPHIRLPSHQVSWRVDAANNGAAKRYDGGHAYSIMEHERIDGPMTVYNMSVQDDESYVTTGGCVHNCASFPNGRNDDWTDTVTCMISYARTTNLLEIAPDALSDQELHDIEEEEATALAHPKAGYGHNRAKPYTQAARGLYGRR